MDGSIEGRDIKNQRWVRKYELVALKKFDNFVNFNDVLNEVNILIKI